MHDAMLMSFMSVCYILSGSHIIHITMSQFIITITARQGPCIHAYLLPVIIAT